MGKAKSPQPVDRVALEWDLLGTPAAASCATDTLDAYLGRLASAAPAPGGGSVAALTAAQGAALVGMVANLTIGRPRFREHEPEVKAILAEAEALRARCTAAIDRDAEALERLMSAYRLPRGTEEERTERSVALQARLREATDVPLDLLRAAASLPPLCRRLLPIGNPTAFSDVGVAAACAVAAAHGAELNVLINLGQLEDAGFVEETRRELADLVPRVERESEDVLRQVRRRLR